MFSEMMLEAVGRITIVDIPALPLVEFTCFPNLPMELRFAIWEQVEKEPRMVRVRETRPSRFAIYQFGLRDDEVKKVNAAVPIILQVNQEARAYANTQYKQIFSDAMASPTRICFETDILVFDRPETWEALLRRCKRRNTSGHRYRGLRLQLFVTSDSSVLSPSVLWSYHKILGSFVVSSH